MTFKDYIGSGSTGIIGVLSTVIVPVIFAFAFAAFIWGIVNYFFLNGSEEAKRGEGRQFIFWGIIGMVVMFSVWGFVSILLSTLGIAP
jgi:heme/copper-type cytochrome/quinol oxidase subunit 4